MTLKVKRLTDTARLPERNNATDAGFDIFSDTDYDLRDFKEMVKTVATGIAVEIPTGYYGRLVARSGNTIKTGLRVYEGTIDSGYRGEVMVMCSGDHTVRAGDKIAQLIIQPLPRIELQEAEELSESDRGVKGFGSSGT